MTDAIARSLSLVIPGNPVPKGRARKGLNGAIYTPEATRIAEEEVAWRIKVARIEQDYPAGSSGNYMGKAFRLTVHFYTFGHRDSDNCLKLLKDAITKAGNIWQDDARCIEEHIYLIRRSKEPRTELLLETL